MRVYTVEEAQALLPQVVPMLERLQTAFVEYRALQSNAEAVARGATGDGHALADPWTEGGEDRIEALQAAIRTEVDQLQDWGIEVKDPAQGLIDFYSHRDGELIFLCFLLGEPAIGHWHTLSGGFAGRQPL